MTEPSLVERVRSARVVQVGAVYLGASWVILQAVDTLQGLLALPSWVGPVSVLLLLVGLLVVLATAWVQSLPQTTAAEEAGEVPTDWQVAPADALKSLSAGQLPHLTWGRAIVGGVFALSLLFGFAGLAVLVRGPLVGPQSVRADASAEGIAVLPFQMSGEGMDVYREGMVALVAANLDGLNGYRAVDARTLLARWNQDIGETADVALERGLGVAGAVGARYAVVGSGVDAGSQIRLNAEIYDIADGRQVGDGAQVEGAEDDVLGLVDALTVEVMRSFLAGSGAASQAQALRVASLLTESVPALRNFLEGDALFRRTRFEDARVAFEGAIEEDSTFALALWRLGDTYGWIEDIGSARSREFRGRAALYADRLPARERTLLTFQTELSNAAFGDGDMARLRDYIQRYPDDPDGWYMLGEVGMHATSPTGLSDAELEQALYRTVELDPTFGPYYQHALEWATAKGHAARYDALLAAADGVGNAPERLERARLRWGLFHGDDGARAAAEVRLGELDPGEVLSIDQTAIGLLDTDLARLRPFWDGRNDEQATVARLYGEQGRLAEMVQLAENADEATLSAAILQLTDWVEAGAVPDELTARLDRALGRRAPDDGAIYAARVELDRALGRELDVEAYRQFFARDTESLATMMAARFDTVGFRNAARTVVEMRLLDWAGDPEAAMQLLGDAMEIEIEPPRDVTADLGLIAVNAGAYEQGIQTLESASRGFGRTLVKFHLGGAYEAVGDTAKALDAYRTFLSRTGPADEQLGAVIEAREAVARLGG